MAKPDERSVMTYVAAFYHALAGDQKVTYYNFFSPQFCWFLINHISADLLTFFTGFLSCPPEAVNSQSFDLKINSFRPNKPPTELRKLFKSTKATKP